MAVDSASDLHKAPRAEEGTGSGHTTNVQPPLLGLPWSTASNRTFSSLAATRKR
jgi:hypothetical protein